MENILSSCKTAIIIPICTKVDSKETVLSERQCDNILQEFSQLIKKSTDGENKVMLVDEINQITIQENIDNGDLNDPRKSLKYLRDLVTALSQFSFKGQFHIPNSWDSIGKYHLILCNHLNL